MAIAGSAVTLTLATAVVAGDAVTVAYTKPDSNPIRDTAMNEAATFSAQTVTNNTPGILLSVSTLTVAEGDSATYTVKLNTAPNANVTVTVARAAGGSDDVTFDTNDGTDGDQDTLTFTMTDYSMAQTVTVSAATDTDTDNDTATLNPHRGRRRLRFVHRRPRRDRDRRGRLHRAVTGGHEPGGSQRQHADADLQRGAGHGARSGQERVHGGGGRHRH